MDARRGKRRFTPPAAAAASTGPHPLGTADNAAIVAKLNDVLARQDVLLQEQHELRRLVHRMTVVVDVLASPVAAARLGVSVRTLERITARGVFTDARAPERRVCGADRVYYADELDVYRSDGERGVERLRKELGRA